MTTTNSVPQLDTPGRIAEKLDVPIHRVAYVIRTRDIRPAARAGRLRLFNVAAIDRIRDELAAMKGHGCGVTR